MAISLIAVWPFYLTKKEGLSFGARASVIVWSRFMACRFLVMRRALRFCYFKGEIMKRLFSVVVSGCVLGVLWLGSVDAQEPGTKIRVSIPCDFTVKGKT